MGDRLLTADRLSLRFGQTDALREVSLSIAMGEVVAIMGPSGSGKSTLLHCLAGVLVPDLGEVHYQGRIISRLSDDQRGRLRLTEFGFVFQFGQLLPELTARDNVMLPLLLNGANRHAAATVAMEWLARLGVENQHNRLPTQMSGGQAQRVAIARAMVGQPKILFGDEPTGALDTLTAESVMEVMLDAVAETGTTLVLVTHDPRTAAYADRQVMMRDGAITLDPTRAMP